MTRRLKQLALVILILAAAQFVRPDRANPPTDDTRTLHAHAELNELAAVMDRSCRDCHSNLTVWPTYAKIAPLSWVMAYAVREGRDAVNFSEWSGYSPEQQRSLMDLSCRDVSEGKMPGIYARLQPETRLSVEDIDIICTAARQMAANTARRP